MDAQHYEYMEEALTLAKLAQQNGDVPVGCVIVREGEIVGRGQNRREERGDATAHAELEAIRDACQTLGRWRLSDCALYVTLEPCFMCAGGIANARLERVYYGAKDEKAGGCGSIINLFEEGTLHRPRLYYLQHEGCKQVLTDFFAPMRNKGSSGG